MTELLLGRGAIAHAVGFLGEQIGATYGEQDLTIVSILHGAMIFTADLIRELEMPLRLETVVARSYRGENTRPGELRVHLEHPDALAGRHVLIVDDILDTGRTLTAVRANVAAAGAADVRCAVLLDKPSRRVTPIEADFVGFEIPDVFVVGYGLDWNGRHRNLPDILSLSVPEESGPSNAPLSSR